MARYGGGLDAARRSALLGLGIAAAGCNAILGLEAVGVRDDIAQGGGGAGGAGGSGGAGGTGGTGGTGGVAGAGGCSPGSGSGGAGGGGTNLLFNGSFETSTTGWSEFAMLDVSSVLVCEDAVDGVRVLQVTNPNADATSGELRQVLSSLAVPTDQCLRLSVWSRYVDGTVFNAALGLRQNGPSSTFGSVYAPLSLNPTFERHEITCHTDREISGGAVVLDVSTTMGGAPATFQFDDARLEIYACAGGEQPCFP